MNTPLFFNSTSALSTQKPLSRTNTLLSTQTGCVSHRTTVMVFPFHHAPCFQVLVDSPCLLSSQPPRQCHYCNNLHHGICSKGQGSLGMNMKPRLVHSFTHFERLSSMQLIQLGMKLSAMLAFHASNILETSQKWITMCWGTLRSMQCCSECSQSNVVQNVLREIVRHKCDKTKRGTFQNVNLLPQPQPSLI